jgi:hypothetical protein
MATKLFPTLATLAIALAGAVATSAMAVEATQYVPEHGNLSRPEVKLGAAQDTAGTRVVQHGEATAFVDAPAAPRQTPVLAFAPAGQSAAARVVHIGEATVFVDAPSARSRADVRNETLAALQAARAH